MSLTGSGVSAGTIYANLKLNSSLDKDTKKANRSLDSIATKFAAVGVAGVTAAAAITAKFVKMAAEEEVVSRRTSALLKAQGIIWDDVSASLDTYLKGIERLTSYNDTDLQEAFNTLLVSGMSYSDAMETMNTVTSMSYSLNRDLVSMAMLVGKAYNGQTGELSRYGIVLDQSLDQSQKFAALQAYVNSNFADASDRTGTLQGQMDVLKNSMFNVAEAMGAQLIPDLIDALEDLNAWGDEGGWETTADVLSRIADSLMAIGYSAAYVSDTIGMAYHGTVGIFDTLGEKYYNLFDDSQLSDKDKATRDWYGQQAAYHGGMVNQEGAEFRQHFNTAGMYGAGALWGYEPYRPPTTVTSGGSVVTPAAASVSGSSSASGSIPAWAGHGKQLQAYYGSSTYTGSSSSTSSSGESAVSMLSSINKGIEESVKVQKDIITAVKNIKIRSGSSSGGFGSSGSGGTGAAEVTTFQKYQAIVDKVGGNIVGGL